MAIAGNQITRAKIVADAIDGTKVADDTLDSEHYIAASIDNEHLADNAVGTDEIAADAVTYAKIQNVSATDKILGRDSASAGIIEEIAPSAVRTMLNVEDGATADQSNAEIVAAVEAGTDSNTFTDADHTKLNGITASANAYVHPNHSGEVTSTADGATVIAGNIVDEANLKVSNAPTNGHFLSAQSGDTGGMTWAAATAAATNTSRNLIINGAMEIAQRGTSHTTAAATYLLDRFYTYTAAANRTISQTTDAPDGFKHSIKLARDSGTAVNPQYFSQPCESSACVGFAGETITLSFWAKAGANFSPASNYINVGVHTGTGTDQSMMGGLTGSAVVIGTTNQAITTDWARYSFTSGSAVPTTSNQLVFQIITTPVGTAGANDWYEITGVQIEIGSAATAFVHESFADTLRKCKRYYESSYPVGTVPGVASFVHGYISKALGGVVTSEIPGPYYTVEKRTTPTVVIYQAVSGATATVYRVDDGSSQGISGYEQDGVHGGGYLQLSSGEENSYKYHFSASAEL